MSIRRRLGIVLLALTPFVVLGCGWFEDQRPEYVYFKVDGPAGTQVQAVYSTQFVAAVDERGVTQLNVFATDTVVHSLPVDTSFFVAIDRRWFVELTPLSVEQASLKVRVDVDDRNQIDESGIVSVSAPWRFAYLFNQQITRLIDIVI
ncbi:MAG TPA: hypothetical protein VLA36_03765 [Longimicrobiales bacterium]|nr:hypothetical protein [Longimicrobiales bacterium]